MAITTDIWAVTPSFSATLFRAAGAIGGAALDVYEIEPLPADHPLWDAPNTILTPHTAAVGGANLEERRYEIVLDNFRNLADGKPLRNEVDKANWF